MITRATIQIIGFAKQEPQKPNSDKYPHWTTFSIAINKKKIGQDETETTWFDCKTNNEFTEKKAKAYVRKGAYLLVEGYPKAKGFIDRQGNVNSNIELYVTNIEPLGPKNASLNQKEETSFDEDIPF